MIGVLGMLFGASVYVTFYPTLLRLIEGFGDDGKVTLPQLTGTSPWLWISGLAIVAVTAYIFSTRVGSTASRNALKSRKVDATAQH